MDKNKIIEGASKLVAKGAYDKAIKEYQKVLDADPRDVRILQKMGELHQKKNDNVEAARYFTKVAESYSTDGFFLKAVALYKQVLKLNPGLLEVNLKLAELHQQLQLMSEAMNYYQLVANHYDKAGDVKSSLDTLKKMVDLDPENVTSREKLAELYARERMPVQALPEFKRAADYYKKNSRTEDYLRVAEKMMAIDGSNLDMALELAELYLGRGDQKRALAKLQIRFKADPRDVGTLTLLAQAFEGLGQVSKTISVFKELAKLHEENGKQNELARVWAKVAELDANDPDLPQQWRSAKSAPPPPPSPARNAAPTPPPPSKASPPPAPARAAASSPRPPPPPPVTTEPSSGGVVSRDQLDKLLTETEVYVKYGLHDKALEHLRKIFTVDPENLDAHEKAYQIYLGSGDTEQAFEQLLNVLRLCTRAAEIERAQPYLAAVLEQQPDHPEVATFLSVLGAQSPNDDSLEETVEPELEPVDEEPVEEELVEADPELDNAILMTSTDDEVIVSDAPPDALVATPEELALLAASQDEGTGEEVVDDDDNLKTTFGELPRFDAPPLPSKKAAAPAPAPARAPVRAASLPPEQFYDDDDGDNVKTTFGELPSFQTQASEEPALEDPALISYEESDEVVDEPALEDEPPALSLEPEELAAQSAGDDEVVSEEDSDRDATDPRMDLGAEEESATQTDARVEPTAEPEPEVEDPVASECDEAAFFIEQGELEEAQEILETILLSYSDHPRASQLMIELEAKRAETSAAEEAPVDTRSDDGERDAFDLAAELAGELTDFAEEEPAALPSGDDFQYSVEEVFSEFKKGLEKVVKPEDVETHYDLGIAYKEMGLMDDALKEFAVARQGCLGKKKEVDCLTMMGLMQVMKGEPAAAVDSFKEALRSELVTADIRQGLQFELGAAHEAAGNPGKALWWYQQVAERDGKFRDVSAIVARLSNSAGPEEDGPPKIGKGGKGGGGSSGTGTSAKTRKVGYV
jgi:pilus assembly protein FimV